MGESWSCALTPRGVMTSTKQVLNRWWHSTPQRLSQSLGQEFEILFFICRANTCQKWQTGLEKFINVKFTSSSPSRRQMLLVGWNTLPDGGDNSTCFHWLFKCCFMRCFHYFQCLIKMQWTNRKHDTFSVLFKQKMGQKNNYKTIHIKSNA